MIKYIPFIAVLLITINVFGQNTIQGHVLDQAKKPIPYVNIGILSSTTGTISNEDGSFQIQVPELNIKDTLLFSALGYERKSFPIQSLSPDKALTVSLPEKITTLQTLTILAKREKKETYWLGNRYEKGGFFYADSISAGSAMALLIENKYPAFHKNLEFPLYVEEAILKIHTNEMGEFKVRVRFLEVDSLTKLPGRDLFEESLVVTSDIKSGWMSFDLSSFNLKIDKTSFFLAFEWILNDHDRLNLLNQYKSFRKEHPEKVPRDTLAV